MRLAGIILAGGSARRMGRPKPWLPFGRQTMLQRVADRLLAAAEPVIVVAAPTQSLPDLPHTVFQASDDWPGQGPMAGMVSGMRRLVDRADAAYVCGCDVPMLAPAFVSALADLAEPGRITVPVVDGRYEPLAAVYPLNVLPEAETLIAAGHRSFLDLYERVAVQRVDAEALRAADPTLGSLRNLNTPEGYALALREAFG